MSTPPAPFESGPLPADGGNFPASSQLTSPVGASDSLEVPSENGPTPRLERAPESSITSALDVHGELEPFCSVIHKHRDKIPESTIHMLNREVDCVQLLCDYVHGGNRGSSKTGTSEMHHAKEGLFQMIFVVARTGPLLNYLTPHALTVALVNLFRGCFQYCTQSESALIQLNQLNEQCLRKPVWAIFKYVPATIDTLFQVANAHFLTPLKHDLTFELINILSTLAQNKHTTYFVRSQLVDGTLFNGLITAVHRVAKTFPQSHDIHRMITNISALWGVGARDVPVVPDADVVNVVALRHALCLGVTDQQMRTSTILVYRALLINLARAAEEVPNSAHKLGMMGCVMARACEELLRPSPDRPTARRAVYQVLRTIVFDIANHAHRELLVRSFMLAPTIKFLAATGEGDSSTRAEELPIEIQLMRIAPDAALVAHSLKLHRWMGELASEGLVGQFCPTENDPDKFKTDVFAIVTTCEPTTAGMNAMLEQNQHLCVLVAQFHYSTLPDADAVRFLDGVFAMTRSPYACSALIRQTHFINGLLDIIEREAGMPDKQALGPLERRAFDVMNALCGRGSPLARDAIQRLLGACNRAVAGDRLLAAVRALQVIATAIEASSDVGRFGVDVVTLFNNLRTLVCNASLHCAMDLLRVSGCKMVKRLGGEPAFAPVADQLGVLEDAINKLRVVPFEDNNMEGFNHPIDALEAADMVSKDMESACLAHVCVLQDRDRRFAAGEKLPFITELGGGDSQTVSLFRTLRINAELGWEARYLAADFAGDWDCHCFFNRFDDAIDGCELQLLFHMRKALLRRELCRVFAMHVKSHAEVVSPLTGRKVCNGEKCALPGYQSPISTEYVTEYELALIKKQNNGNKDEYVNAIPS